MKLSIFIVLLFALFALNAKAERSPNPIVHSSNEHLHMVLLSEDALNKIDLGNLKLGKSYKVAFEVLNAGNTAAKLKSKKINDQFKLNHNCSGYIGSSESCKFELEIQTSKTGKLDQFLELNFQTKSGLEQNLGLSLYGHIIERLKHSNTEAI